MTPTPLWLPRQHKRLSEKAGDQVPVKLLGKRTAEAYAEAQLDAMRRLSRQGIQTAGMDRTRKEMNQEEEDMDWVDGSD